MPDNGSQEELTLRRMPDGGFLVLRHEVNNTPDTLMYANEVIDNALSYIKDKVNPIVPSQAPAGE